MIAVLTLLGAVARRAVRFVVSTVGATGWVVLALGVLAVAVGHTLGWSEFVYLGVTLLAATLVAVPFAWGRLAYSVSVGTEPRRASVAAPGRTASDRPTVRVFVQNLESRTLLPARMEVPMTGVTPTPVFPIPSLRAREGYTHSFPVDTRRRAIITVGPVVSVRGDQLGLLRRTVRWTEPQEVFVRPRTVHVPSSASGLVRDLEGRTTDTVTNSDLSFHALRPYEPGDDTRLIHWKATARASSTTPGAMMVRQFEETRRSQLTILHATDQAWYEDDDEFELAVSLMASIASQALREGTDVAVVTEDGKLDTRSVGHFLDDTCRIGPARVHFPGVRSFAAAKTRELPAASIVVVIGGSRMIEDDFRTVEHQFPADTSLWGIRASPAKPLGVTRPGRMIVMSARALEDLPKLMSRVL
jgi:uncharacterized protein (DUF58 family)